MGTWLNVAFVQTDDLARVEQVVRELVVERGRMLVQPPPRAPEYLDPMQYGRGDEVFRWGIAGFRGAPGWTVVRTAPFELLLDDDPPLLAELARRVGVPAFQYNVYDGDSHFLCEAAADGRVERSGFAASDPSRHWGDELPEDRFELRFRIIEVAPAAEHAERTMPEASVTSLVPTFRRPDKQLTAEDRARAEPIWREAEEHAASRRAALLAWLDEAGGRREASGTYELWRAHPGAVVRALAAGGDSMLGIEGVCDVAIREVFGGASAEACDNRLLVEVLVPHAAMPVAGFVIYADR